MQPAYMDLKYNGVPPNSPLPVAQPAVVAYPPPGVTYTTYTPYTGQPTVAYGMADPFVDVLATEKKMRRHIKLIKFFALLTIIGGIIFVAAHLTYAVQWVWGSAIQRTRQGWHFLYPLCPNARNACVQATPSVGSLNFSP